MERVAKGQTELSRAIESLRYFAHDIGVLSEKEISMPDYFRAHTRPEVRYIADNFLQFLAARRITRMESITPSNVTEYLQTLTARLSPGTVKNYHVIIGSVFRAAVNDAIITRNPAALAKLPAATVAPAERKAFTMEELHYLISAMPHPWPSVIKLTYLAGGLRLGDVCMLRWDAVDMDAAQIVITPRKTRKTGKRLLIPITPALRSVLLDLPRAGEYVFPELAADFQRSRVIPSAFFISWVKKLGLDQTIKIGTRNFSQLSFHSIRHTVVTHLRAAGVVAPDVVRSIVGHTSEQVERGYFHAPAAARMEGYSFLADSLEK